MCCWDRRAAEPVASGLQNRSVTIVRRQILPPLGVEGFLWPLYNMALFFDEAPGPSTRGPASGLLA
jgi:hypothetical protein